MRISFVEALMLNFAHNERWLFGSSMKGTLLWILRTFQDIQIGFL